jgi:hypothetical protein
MKALFLLVTIVLLFDETSTAQQNDPASLKSLTGIKVVRVAVAICCADTKQYAPSEDRIRAALEAHLRSNGIGILSKAAAAPGDSTLYIEVTSFKNSTTSLYDCYSAISLDQDIVLVRDSRIRNRTSTWSKFSIGTSAINKLKSDQESRINALLGLFIRAWRSANP